MTEHYTTNIADGGGVITHVLNGRNTNSGIAIDNHNYPTRQYEIVGRPLAYR